VIHLHSLSPYCLRRLSTRSDCSWWGVSASCPRRRSDASDFSKVGIYRSSFGWYSDESWRTPWVGSCRKVVAWFGFYSVVKEHHLPKAQTIACGRSERKKHPLLPNGHERGLLTEILRMFTDCLQTAIEIPLHYLATGEAKSSGHRWKNIRIFKKLPMSANTPLLYKWNRESRFGKTLQKFTKCLQIICIWNIPSPLSHGKAKTSRVFRNIHKNLTEEWHYPSTPKWTWDGRFGKDFW